MMSYQHFAFIYDNLMTDVPYKSWVEYVEHMITKYGATGKQLLDVGCGTGTLSMLFAEKGYRVTGVDLSDEMLAIAQAKSTEENLEISFVQQDMRNLAGFHSYDIVGIFCDSLNYLKDEDEIEATFRNIFDCLKPDGLLVFDVHSLFKMDEIFLGHSYNSTDEDISYIWNCYEGEQPFSVEHELTFFVKNNDHYERFDEVHFQRTFPIKIYKNLLVKVGFEVIEVNGDFTLYHPNEQSERIFFTARKKQVI